MDSELTNKFGSVPSGVVGFLASFMRQRTEIASATSDNGHKRNYPAVAIYMWYLDFYGLNFDRAGHFCRPNVLRVINIDSAITSTVLPGLANTVGYIRPTSWPDLVSD